MNQPSPSEYVPGQPGSRFEPYVRLVRSLLPRTSCVAMFGASGELIWSSDTTTGPDLMNIVDDALLSAGANPGSPGQLRLLAGNLPVYLCWLRDEAQQLAGDARRGLPPERRRATARSPTSPSPTRCCARCSSACAAT